MKKIDTVQTLSLLGNLAVLVGMVFIAYELRQNTVATQLMASESHFNAAMTLNTTISANPELAAILASVIEGKELTLAEELQFTNLIASIFRSWQNLYFQYERGAISEEVLSGYDKTIIGYMLQTPRIIDLWYEWQDRYTRAFASHAEMAIASIPDD